MPPSWLRSGNELGRFWRFATKTFTPSGVPSFLLTGLDDYWSNPTPKRFQLFNVFQTVTFLRGVTSLNARVRQIGHLVWHRLAWFFFLFFVLFFCLTGLVKHYKRFGGTSGNSRHLANSQSVGTQIVVCRDIPSCLAIQGREGTDAKPKKLAARSFCSPKCAWCLSVRSTLFYTVLFMQCFGCN